MDTERQKRKDPSKTLESFNKDDNFLKILFVVKYLILKSISIKPLETQSYNKLENPQTGNLFKSITEHLGPCIIRKSFVKNHM